MGGTSFIGPDENFFSIHTVLKDYIPVLKKLFVNCCADTMVIVGEFYGGNYFGDSAQHEDYPKGDRPNYSISNGFVILILKLTTPGNSGMMLKQSVISTGYTTPWDRSRVFEHIPKWYWGRRDDLRLRAYWTLTATRNRLPKVSLCGLSALPMRNLSVDWRILGWNWNVAGCWKGAPSLLRCVFWTKLWFLRHWGWWTARGLIPIKARLDQTIHDEKYREEFECPYQWYLWRYSDIATK